MRKHLPGRKTTSPLRNYLNQPYELSPETTSREPTLMTRRDAMLAVLTLRTVHPCDRVRRLAVACGC